MDPFESHLLGKSNLRIQQFGFGAGPLGDMTEIISDEQALETLDAAFDSGTKFYDTAPFYGLTKSEHRVGQFLRQKPSDSFSINTKVGRIFSRPDNIETFRSEGWIGGLPFQLHFDYSREGFQRSYEDSLQRLGLNRVNALAVHDLDPLFHSGEDELEARLDELDQGGGIQWLSDAKSRGEIDAFGAGMNDTLMVPRFLERFKDWDYFIIAGTYTLLDQPALDNVLDLCGQNGISVIIGGVFSSGILATGIQENARYRYQKAEGEVIQRVSRIEEVCRRHGVPMGAAALQFPFGHPSVVSVIPGMNSSEIVKMNLEWFEWEIPSDFWAELKAERLLRADAPTP